MQSKKPVVYFVITFCIIQMASLSYGIWGAIFNIPLNWSFLIGVYIGGIFVAIFNYLIFDVIGIEYEK